MQKLLQCAALLNSAILMAQAQLIDSQCFEQVGNLKGSSSIGDRISNLDELYD